jgi:hypothetical protein
MCANLALWLRATARRERLIGPKCARQAGGNRLTDRGVTCASLVNDKLPVDDLEHGWETFDELPARGCRALLAALIESQFRVYSPRHTD